MIRKDPGTSAKQRATATELRGRALLILDSFEHEEPSSTWQQMRELVHTSTRIGDLRTIVLELRSAMAGLTPEARLSLDHRLAEQFGADEEQALRLALVVEVLKRGCIRSEEEFRIVQAVADSIAADLARGAEFLQLGSLLDEYSAAP
jgi:hypothetical protein